MSKYHSRGGIRGRRVELLILDDIGEAVMTKSVYNHITGQYEDPNVPVIPADKLATNVIPGMIPSFHARKKNKFAPVCPVHIYEAFANRNVSLDNVLLLAHDIVKIDNAKRYEQVFKNGAYHHHVTNIILDNSLIETGSAVDLEMIKEAVDIINPSVIVLPDILNGGLKSATLTINAWDSFKTAFPHLQMLAVLQGSSMKEWLQAAETIQMNMDPDWISVPRCMEGIDGYTRSNFVEYAEMIFPDKPIHLLGFSDEPWEDIDAAQYKSVKCIDSAAPFRFESGFILGGETGPRGDWWETVSFHKGMIDTMDRINKYINRQ